MNPKDALAIGRTWAEREWDARPEARRLERWRPVEADALLLLLGVPSTERAALVEFVITAAAARWLELLADMLAGSDEAGQ